MATGRSPPARQGTITVNTVVSQNEINVRKKNANTYSGIDNGTPGAVRIYLYGGDERYQQVLEGEFALAYRGSRGVDSTSKKIIIFNTLNGITIPGDATIEDVENGVMVVGVCKIDYDAQNPATPQNGVSVGIRGVFRVPWNTDVRRCAYPGEYFTIAFPDPSSGSRTFPMFNTIPSQKILPALRPLDFGSLKNTYSEVSNNAYVGDLAAVQIYDQLHKAKTPLTPFQVAVHRKKTSVLVQALRVIEVLAMRGDIIINTGAAVAAGTKTDPKVKMIDMMRQTGADAINKKRQDVYELGERMGVIAPSTFANNTPLPSDNQLQQDIFYASMYPHVPSLKQPIYKPNIGHKIKTPASGNIFESGRLDQKASHIRVQNEAYVKMASGSQWDADQAMHEYKLRLGEKIGGKLLEPVNPNNQNPHVDVLVGVSVNIM